MTGEVRLPRDDVWADQLLLVVRTRFGQEVPERRRETLRRAAIEAYVASKEPSLDAYIARLAAAPLDSPCVAELIGRFTVKESYFFRDELMTFALRDVVLPRLLARASRSKELSVWCAGSANGEEPYTIAILLETLAEAAPGVKIRIVGTDLDEGALRFARKGEYGEWSVRSLPDALRERHFEKRGSRFLLRERHRRWVRFESLNLADPDAAPPDPGTFDLVLCRNVAIYFSDDALATLYRKLAAAIKPGGFVITAPSDPSPSAASGLEPIILREGTHATVVYVQGGARSPLKRPWSDPPAPATNHEPHLSTIPGPPLLDPIVPSSIPSPPASVRVAVETKRADPPTIELAPSTREETERAIARSPLDAAPYFALALLELELDEYDAAEAALKKVLYLAPNFAEAHYRLGLLRQRRGDFEGARRSLWNALDLLRNAGEGAESWAASLGLSLAALERRR